MDGNAATRRLVGSLAIFVSLPLLFLAGYVEWMHAPVSAVLPHLYVVASIASALAGTRLLLSMLPIWPALQRALAAFVICGVFFSFIALYAGAMIGLTFWGKVATVQLIGTYAAQLPASLKAMGFAPMLVAVAAGSVFVLIAASVYLFLHRYDWIPEFRLLVSPLPSAITAIGLLCIAVASAVTFDVRGWGAAAEPLSLSLFPAQAERAAQSHGVDIFRATALQLQHDAVRASYTPSAGARKSNVVLIVVDALRADHLSLFNYTRKTSPNLDQLQAQGFMRLATSAVAVCNESFCGLRALASSQNVDSQAERPFTLHEVLKKHGYAVHLVFSGDHTNFYGLSQIYGQVDSYVDGASQKTRYLNDDRLVVDHLDSVPRWNGTPTMFQFHLMSTHALGLRFEETAEFGPSRSYTGMRWGSSVADMPQLATNYYDRGVLQTDEVIAKLLKQMQERGYLEDALVVITGDHGESLGERGLYSHTHGVWEESLRVPFLVLAFGGADLGELESSQTISQIDIAPTVLHALGMRQPSTWQGTPAQMPRHRRYVNFQQAHLLGLIDSESPNALYKYWVDARSGKEQTFDLLQDPREKIDITGQIPPALRTEWRQHLIQHSGALLGELQDRLQSLPLD